MRRPFIYPHRSARALPLTLGRAGGAISAAAALTIVVWRLRGLVVAAHNAVVVQLCRAAGLEDARTHFAPAFGLLLEVVTVPSSQVHAAMPWLAAGCAIALLATVAVAFPLLRGLAAFIVVVITLSLVSLLARAPAMQTVEGFATLWMQTELLVWLALPSVTTFLFVIVQPSLIRGFAWMVGVEAFAILWSAVRLVVLLGFGFYTGTALLLALWFVGGLLADALYLVTFYSWSIHANLNFSRGR